MNWNGAMTLPRNHPLVSGSPLNQYIFSQCFSQTYIHTEIVQLFIVTVNLLNDIVVCPWTCHHQSVVGTLLINITRGSGMILCMGSVNERRRSIVTSSLIGWTHDQNDPWSLCNVAKWWTIVTSGINRTNMCVCCRIPLCNLIKQCLSYTTCQHKYFD